MRPTAGWLERRRARPVRGMVGRLRLSPWVGDGVGGTSGCCWEVAARPHGEGWLVQALIYVR